MDCDAGPKGPVGKHMDGGGKVTFTRVSDVGAHTVLEIRRYSYKVPPGNLLSQKQFVI